MLARFFGWLFPPKYSHLDVYHVASVTSLAELEDEERLPLELRFVFKEDPGRRKDVESLLASGYGIGVRTVKETPRVMLEAVEHISRLTQENTIIPWLPRLFRTGDMPTFMEAELRMAERQGVALYESVRRLLEYRYVFKQIVLIDLRNQGITETHRQCMVELNEVLHSYALDYAIHRVLTDSARTVAGMAPALVGALSFIGPVAHVLEHWIGGAGKLFAISVRQVFGEASESLALHTSGFTWRQLLQRVGILGPVLVLVVYGVFLVERFVDRGQLGVAGLLFGGSAAALSFSILFRSTRIVYQAFASLERDGKLRSHERRLWRLALWQDFSQPVRFGLLAGIFFTPVLAVIVFVLFPGWTENGWVLALLGSTELLVASVAILVAPSLREWCFHRRMRRLIMHS